MRIFEIVNEVYIETLDPERLELICVMYGDDPIDSAAAELDLAAQRMDILHKAAEIERIRIDAQAALNPLDDELVRARITKIETDTASARHGHAQT